MAYDIGYSPSPEVIGAVGTPAFEPRGRADAVPHLDTTPFEMDHAIDVDTLAPALLAFGKLIREANAEINGKRATARVLVVSDFEHKCFNINFDVVVSWFEQLKSFLDKDDVATAKTIIEWLMAGGAVGTVVRNLSFFGYLEWRRGRKVTEAKPLTDKDSTGLVEVRVDGDGNSVTVNQHIYQLSQNPRALRAARDTLLPVSDSAYDSMRIEEGGATIHEITTEEVQNIVASCAIGIEEAKEVEPDVQMTPVWLTVYSPVFDARADNWRFRLGTDIIHADISETKIGEAAVERGGVFTEDSYQVRLEITTHPSSDGKEPKRTYKVLEVLRFVPGEPPARQTSLLDPPPRSPRRRPPRKR